jgi:ABC-type antimicrobial peptide transport system permease subunit
MVTSSLRELLYEVARFDATTVFGATILVGLVAIVAAMSPAWRAARIDPVAALRAD